jgi:hypothetical protein
VLILLDEFGFAQFRVHTPNLFYRCAISIPACSSVSREYLILPSCLWLSWHIVKALFTLAIVESTLVQLKFEVSAITARVGHRAFAKSLILTRLFFAISSCESPALLCSEMHAPSCYRNHLDDRVSRHKNRPIWSTHIAGVLVRNHTGSLNPAVFALRWNIWLLENR